MEVNLKSETGKRLTFSYNLHDEPFCSYILSREKKIKGRAAMDLEIFCAKEEENRGKHDLTVQPS